jgi:hypothetical protein
MRRRRPDQKGSILSDTQTALFPVSLLLLNSGGKAGIPRPKIL